MTVLLPTVTEWMIFFFFPVFDKKEPEIEKECGNQEIFSLFMNVLTYEYK